MDYRKLSSYVSQIRTEETNLTHQMEELQSHLLHLERKLRIRRCHLQVLQQVHNKIFEAAAEGKDQAKLFLYLDPSVHEDTAWSTLPEAHSSLQQILRDVGVKDLHVESLIHFRIRQPKGIIPHDDCDTVINFSIS